MKVCDHQINGIIRAEIFIFCFYHRGTQWMWWWRWRKQHRRIQELASIAFSDGVIHVFPNI